VPFVVGCSNNYLGCYPDNCVVTGTDIKWHFEDFEPVGDYLTIDASFIPLDVWQAILVERQNTANNPKDGEAWGRLGQAYKEALVGYQGNQLSTLTFPPTPTPGPTVTPTPTRTRMLTSTKSLSPTKIPTQLSTPTVGQPSLTPSATLLPSATPLPATATALLVAQRSIPATLTPTTASVIGVVSAGRGTSQASTSLTEGVGVALLVLILALAVGRVRKG
jgi:hypothetical protein